MPRERTITFDRYTGKDHKRERKRIADEPPQILRADFMMLEFLMTRQEEFTRATTDLLTAHLRSHLARLLLRYAERNRRGIGTARSC